MDVTTDVRAGVDARPVLSRLAATGWLGAAATVLLLAGCAVVPVIFTTHYEDVFYLPKLVALWILLGVLLWLMAVAALRGQLGERFRLIGWVDGPVAVFVVLNLLALAFSVDKHQSLFGERLQYQGILTMLLYVAFFYVARLLLCDERSMVLLFASVSVGATLVSGYAIVQRLGIDPIWNGYLPNGRVFSTIGQPDALAAYLVIAIPVTAALVVFCKNALRLVALAALAAMVVAFLLTHSRSGDIGLVAAVLVFLFGAWDGARAWLGGRRQRVTIVVVVVVLVLAVAVIPPARHQVSRAWHHETSATATTGDRDIGARIDMWRVAVRIIGDHPVLGTGPETYPEEFPTYSPVVLSPRSARYFSYYRVESPHDEVLRLAVGGGIPTALAYLFFLGAVALTLWRTLRRTKDAALRLAMVAMLSAAVGYFVTDCFNSTEISGGWLFWTLLGAAVGISAATRSSGVQSDELLSVNSEDTSPDPQA
jgi:O-antigen ligase